MFPIFDSNSDFPHSHSAVLHENEVHKLSVSGVHGLLHIHAQIVAEVRVHYTTTVLLVHVSTSI